MSTEEKVAKHYTRGNLVRTILDGLAASGKETDRIASIDLAPVDEFHLGWRPATIEFAKDLALKAGEKVLDIGSGIGGPARYFAEVHGCRVTGIDLTEEFVEAARTFTERCGLTDRVDFKQGSALAMPFPDATFDAATLIHVGMNIADKAELFSEARRVLKPGGRFGVYDITRVGDGDISYPAPWAGTAETSFVESPTTYRDLLAEAGFQIESETNRRDMVMKLMAERRAQAAAGNAPPLGINVTATPERIANLAKTLEAGTIAPIEFIARAV